MFGFDFNGDGHVSFGEHMVSMDMMGFFDDEKKNDGIDNVDGFGVEDDCEFEDMDVHERLAELESSKSDLEDALFDLELHEPDILSPVYDSWSDHRDALQEQIDQLDCDSSDLEDYI